MANVIAPFPGYARQNGFSVNTASDLEKTKLTIVDLLAKRIDEHQTNFIYKVLKLDEYLERLTNQFTHLKGFLTLVGYPVEAAYDFLPSTADDLKEKIKRYFIDNAVTSDANSDELSSQILGQSYRDFKAKVMSFSDENYDKTLDIQVENTLALFAELPEMINEYTLSMQLHDYCRTANITRLRSVLDGHPLLVNRVYLNTRLLHIAIVAGHSHVVLELLRYGALRDGDVSPRLAREHKREYIYSVLVNIEHVRNELQSVSRDSFIWHHYQVAAAIGDGRADRLDNVLAHLDDGMKCQVLENNPPLWEIALAYGNAETLSKMCEHLANAEYYFYQHPDLLYRFALKDIELYNYQQWPFSTLLLQWGADRLLPSTYKAELESHADERVNQHLSQAETYRRDFLIRHPAQLLKVYPPKNQIHASNALQYHYKSRNFSTVSVKKAHLFRMLRFSNHIFRDHGYRPIRDVMAILVGDERVSPMEWVDARGDNLLHVAITHAASNVSRDEDQLLFTLLDNFPELADQRGEFGWMPLHTAARYGQALVIDQLLRAKYNREQIISQNNFSAIYGYVQQYSDDQRTALELSIMHGHAAVTKLLIKHGALEQLAYPDQIILSLRQLVNNQDFDLQIKQLMSNYLNQHKILRGEHLVFLAAEYGNTVLFDNALTQLNSQDHAYGEGRKFIDLYNMQDKGLLAVAIEHNSYDIVVSLFAKFQSDQQKFDFLSQHGQKALRQIPPLDQLDISRERRDKTIQIVAFIVPIMMSMDLKASIPSDVYSIYNAHQIRQSVATEQAFSDQEYNTGLAIARAAHSAQRVTSLRNNVSSIFAGVSFMPTPAAETALESEPENNSNQTATNFTHS